MHALTGRYNLATPSFKYSVYVNMRNYVQLLCNMFNCFNGDFKWIAIVTFWINLFDNLVIEKSYPEVLSLLQTTSTPSIQNSAYSFNSFLNWSFLIPRLRPPWLWKVLPLGLLKRKYDMNFLNNYNLYRLCKSKLRRVGTNSIFRENCHLAVKQLHVVVHLVFNKQRTTITSHVQWTKKDTHLPTYKQFVYITTNRD